VPLTREHTQIRSDNGKETGRLFYLESVKVRTIGKGICTVKLFYDEE
jgi:hypothetical protein